MREAWAHRGTDMGADRQVRSTWRRYPCADFVGMPIVHGDHPFVYFDHHSFDRLWAPEQVTATKKHADYPVDQLYERE